MSVYPIMTQTAQAYEVREPVFQLIISRPAHAFQLAVMTVGRWSCAAPALAFISLGAGFPSFLPVHPRWLIIPAATAMTITTITMTITPTASQSSGYILSRSGGNPALCPMAYSLRAIEALAQKTASSRWVIARDFSLESLQ